jgi:alpha 1,3-glucosidase
VETFLPGSGPWFNFWDGSEVQRPSGWLGGTQSRFKVPVTMDRIPLYLRGGHITVRRDRPRRSTAAMAADPVTLLIALDAKGEATGDLYLDDGHSFAFRR